MKRLLFSIPMLLLCAFSSLHAADYYWVSGSGNWSDISKWRTTSGGTVQHNTIPTANDRVIFDENSFTGPNQVVTVNNQTIFFQDMDWSRATGNPRFTAPANFVMNVYGGLILNPNMVFDFKGDVYFLATSDGHTIDLQGHTLQRNVYFSSVDGGWTLATPMRVDSLLRFEDGTFNSGSQEIVCEILRITPRTLLNINLGSSLMRITGIPFKEFPGAFRDEPVADIYPQRLTLTADMATLDFNSPLVYFRIREFGTLRFGIVRFSSTVGKSILEIENPSLDARFNILEMRNDTELRGAMKFGELILGPGKNFFFTGGRTYELNTLTALGTCPAPIQVFSNTPGTAVIWRATGGAITGNFMSLRDIHGTGGVSFTANNSADLGNNNGWTINPKANTELYWVGGSGMWNDPMHWALTSGGPGGACVPTANDDVFFDANSFPTPGAVVLVNIDNAYCRSMDWTGANGNPVFLGTMEKNLRIFGSLTLIPVMRYEFEGDVFFESNRLGNSITSAGKSLQKNATFNGQGAWALNDSLTVIRDLFFIQGRLNTNSQNLNIQRFESSNTAAPRNLILGSSYVKMNTPDFQYLYWRANATNFQFNAGTSVIEFFWVGDVDKIGAPSLTYHKVIFRTQGTVYGDASGGANIFDTLTMYGDGYFYDFNRTNVWEIHRGRQYEIYQGDTLEVNRIVAPGGCAGMIELRSNFNNNTSFLRATSSQTLERFIVKDIHSIGSGVLTANNSVNLGNTTGWVFNQNMGRDLYWVGGEGEWNDPTHWSLSSGGPGGECVPTPVDNVFFDANSFTGPNQVAQAIQAISYCKNMLWDGVTGNPFFNMGNLHLFGSMELTDAMRSNFFSLLFLRSEEEGNRIKTAGIPINIFLPKGGGSYILQDTLRASSFEHIHGAFNSNSRPVDIDYYSVYSNTNRKQLILGGSHWRIRGQDLVYRRSWGAFDTLTVQADSSLIEFLHPSAGMFNRFALDLHNVLFSAVDQTSRLETQLGRGTFNRLEFRNSGIILGEYRMDSLIFSPGKSYQLDATKQQEVREYWQVIGNNCLSIELSSTINGQKANVLMNSGTVLADFVQMRDQNALGSVEFFAGVHSTDIASSNTGWIFDAPLDYVDDGILGRDIVLCQASTVTLDARTFSPGETYLWSTGSTAPTLEVSMPGTYWVELRYSDNCTLRDSIILLEPTAFRPFLPADTTLCEGDTLLLTAGIELLGLRFLWQDSTTRPEFVVRQPGRYRLELELSGCTAADSLEVSYIASPRVTLGADSTLCEGQTLTLDATLTGATSYLWQDGSSAPTLTVSQPGTYSVAVFEGRCPGRDTIQISYDAPINLSLGADTTICENTTLTLVPTAASGSTFVWQNGSSSGNFQVNSPGVYSVQANRNNCSERDSITISVQELPRFALGPDTALCQGENLVLNGMSLPGTIYQWSTGAGTESITVLASGVYQLQTSLNGCTFSAEKRVTFKPLPPLNLGPDQTPCADERIILSAVSPGATYLWQDGSTEAQLVVSADGLYWVQATLDGCSSRDSVTFAFRPLPEFELGPDTTLCDGESMELVVATLPGATVAWNSGQSSFSIQVNNAGTFRATTTLNGCTFTDERSIAFNPLPALDLGAAQNPCQGEVVVLDATFPGATYLWQDGSTNATFQVRADGQYVVVSTLNGCSSRDSVTVTFRPLPIFSLGRDTVLCAGQTLPLNVNVPGAQFLWSNGVMAPSLDVSTQGLYWLEATLNGCPYRDSIQVAFVTIPAGRLGNDLERCDGQTAVLDASVNGASYVWQDGSTLPQLEVRNSGTYAVRINVGNCSAQDTVRVVFNPLPVFDLGRDTQLCAPAAFVLRVPIAADAYRWQDGSTQSTFTARQTGLYRATATLNRCDFTDSIRVEILQPSRPNLGSDTLLCEGEVYTLRADVAAQRFLWQDGSTGTTLEVRTPGLYILSAQEGPCSASDSVEISFRRCLEFKAYVPNAFSPNGDGINDYFRPFFPEGVEILEYDFRIFDRWGNLVFQTLDPNQPWEATYRGQVLPQGAYLYYVFLRYRDDKKEDTAKLTGEVLLTR